MCVTVQLLPHPPYVCEIQKKNPFRIISRRAIRVGNSNKFVFGAFYTFVCFNEKHNFFALFSPLTSVQFRKIFANTHMIRIHMHVAWPLSQSENDYHSIFVVSSFYPSGESSTETRTAQKKQPNLQSECGCLCMPRMNSAH